MSTQLAPTERVEDQFDNNDHLTSLQHQVLSLLATGQSVAATARACGLHRSTIYHWQHENPDFARALRDAKSERTNHWHSVVDEHASPAFAFIRATMDNDQAPLSQRLRAAFFLAKASLQPAPAPTKFELQQEDTLRAQREREALSAAYDAERYAEYEANLNEDEEDEDYDDEDEDFATGEDLPANPTDPTQSDTSTPSELSSDAIPHSTHPTNPTQFDTSDTPHEANHRPTASTERDRATQAE